MGALFLETNNDNSILTISGDLPSVQNNRRAMRFLKDNIPSATIVGNCIQIEIAGDNATQYIERVKKVAQFSGCELQFSTSTNDVINDYVKEERQFQEFSQHAADIRNNNCNKQDFESFINAESQYLKNRSLYQLQLLSAYHLAFSQNACNFSVPGAGKTSVVYGAFAYLSNLPQDDPKRVDVLLIISPLSAFGPWESEYEECFGITPTSKRLSGTMLPEEKRTYLYSLNPAKVTLLSYASVPSLRQELIYFLQNNKAMVVLDEAHKIKNTSGGSTAAAVLDIAPFCKARVVLTGTPAPNGYEDLYNLYQFIWPSKKVIPFQAYQLKDMTKNDSDSRVSTLLQNIEPFFIRVKKSDLGITPATENPPIRIPMGNSQSRIYDFIEKKYMNDILNSRDSQFKNDIVKARLIRMMQAATNPSLLRVPLENFAASEGFDPNIVSEDASVINEILQYTDLEIPAKFLKAKELICDIVDGGGKVVVWATYIKNILEFQGYLAQCGIKAKTLYGATPIATGDEEIDSEIDTRESIIKEFHSRDADFNVIIANPFAVAESISLHKVCHNAIYLERTFNAAHFIQSKDRIHRYGLIPGTETNYYYLLSENTVDEVIHDRLLLKESRLREIIESMPIPLFSNVEMETGDEDIKALITEYVRRTKTM